MILKQQMRRVLYAVALVMSAMFVSIWSPALAEDAFIDGFPDVPHLNIVSKIDGEPVVFDTASGTVAEVGLYISVPAATAFSRYSDALKELGWECVLRGTELTCTRNESKLSLTAPDTRTSEAIFILRLEPLQ
ncbi:hypothetical protein [Kordiimonas aquimaris]|uniref:hypothetical protein n=1 Tax=Kordiimonas aquimaris TaxID=707591 RepID=UPI0021CFDCC8|nr:hypothetical protein [Kordiimonas aquimaris]